ncbi:hypothetical protein SAMN05421693_10960 [Ectothiorhodospira magna]|uniref:Uncharacterized protein n=1 Tax=Ectothiorhodospira magna TaxID=867345 RepID=A0A1H9BK10_9GAMM|nr:hypothetical protein [Ectothiorhodospira magna]SEP89296.1 hypothetical protein SAMN05421693_10960 [Ectothiorhodospira magna]
MVSSIVTERLSCLDAILAVDVENVLNSTDTDATRLDETSQAQLIAAVALLSTAVDAISDSWIEQAMALSTYGEARALFDGLETKL